jgi:hypothetical protein
MNLESPNQDVVEPTRTTSGRTRSIGISILSSLCQPNPKLLGVLYSNTTSKPENHVHVFQGILHPHERNKNTNTSGGADESFRWHILILSITEK